MDERYYLITGTSASQVERLTGLRGHDTMLGTLVEEPRPVRIAAAMDELDRALRPNRCTCGAFAIIHRSNCPAGVSS